MPATDAYAFEINLNVTDREDGQQNAPVFRDSFRERFNVSRTGSAGGGGNPGTVLVPITETVITFNLVLPGYVLIKNLDATNFITYGGHATALAGAELGRLYPGQTNVISLEPGITFRAIANTAPCRVQFKGYEF